MTLSAIIAGFSLGAVSSLHCVGMCGPLALALPVHHLTRRAQLLSLFLYQLGRVITYSLFGLLFGLVGRQIYIAGFQQFVSITMGALVLILVILYHINKSPMQPAVLRRFFSCVQGFMIASFREKRNTGGFILMGMANGLLPCAMVYVAVAGAMTSTRIPDAVVFMASFGAGTLPAMLLLSYFGRMVALPIRIRLKQAIPFFMIIIGVVLILRGMNLGIPFISPELPDKFTSAVSCHY